MKTIQATTVVEETKRNKKHMLIGMGVAGWGVVVGIWGQTRPTFGVLFLVVFGPFGLSSIFILCYFIMFILGTVSFVGNLAHQTSDLSLFTDP